MWAQTPLGVGFVGVEACSGLPKMLLHQLDGGVQAGPRAGVAGTYYGDTLESVSRQVVKSNVATNGVINNALMAVGSLLLLMQLLKLQLQNLLLTVLLNMLKTLTANWTTCSKNQ